MDFYFSAPITVPPKTPLFSIKEQFSSSPNLLCLWGSLHVPNCNSPLFLKKPIFDGTIIDSFIFKVSFTFYKTLLGPFLSCLHFLPLIQPLGFFCLFVWLVFLPILQFLPPYCFFQPPGKHPLLNQNPSTSFLIVHCCWVLWKKFTQPCIYTAANSFSSLKGPKADWKT